MQTIPANTFTDSTGTITTGRLPSEYQEVEYIQNQIITASSGSYIDLGFAFDTACTFYINYVPKPNVSSAYLFGAAESSGMLRCMVTDQITNTILYGSNGRDAIRVDTAKYNTEKSIKCEMKKDLLKITDLLNGDSAQYEAQVEYTMISNLFLLAQNYNGSARMAEVTQLKSFSYYDKTNTLICDLVPCYRKSDGVVGMYDLVRKIFLTNVGTGSFLRGPIVGPKSYTNLVSLSTEEDDVTIYGDDHDGDGIKDGYKNGTRIRSGGVLGDHGGASHTGFMRAKGGDVVRLSGYDVMKTNTANAINVYNASHTNLGQITSNSNWSYGIFEGKTHNWDDVILEKSGVYYWIVPDGFGIEYIRVTGYANANGNKMIVTVNEEIE